MSDSFVRQNSADEDKKLDAELLQRGGLDIYRLVSSLPQMAVKVDQSNPLEIYIGDALPGSATSAAVWRIKRVVTSGLARAVEFADGNTNFDNVWDNRVSLSYS